MATCDQCGRRTQDGFVIVSHEPVQDHHSHSEAHHLTRLTELAQSQSEASLSLPSLCRRCGHEVRERIDQLIVELESYNAGAIKYIADPRACCVHHGGQEGPTIEGTMRNIQTQHEKLSTTLHSLQEEEMLLRQEEDKYWSEFLSIHNQLGMSPDLTSTPQIQLDALLDELAPLNQLNIYLDTFIIGITPNGIGTINNLRLGTKPDEIVEWDEINAAWGQSALLLYMLAKKLNVNFSKFRLIPMGARAFIQQKDQQQNASTVVNTGASSGTGTNSGGSGGNTDGVGSVNNISGVGLAGAGVVGGLLPLHGSPAILFNRSANYFYEFWGSSNNNVAFDLAMEAFLLCVSELCARAISISNTISLPYYIDRDKIGTKHSLKSMKTFANNETDWSKALKYMLTNLKRVLGYLPTILSQLNSVQ